jgi:hypothetical protein
MQTFIPYTDFKKNAKTLDYRRLGKQRVECKQILNALNRTTGGWINHPAVKMWKGYEPALRQYMREIILEWVSRGYKNNMTIPEKENFEYPFWWGREEIHASHRAALLEKDFEFYYETQRWEEEPKIQYIWPV